MDKPSPKKPLPPPKYVAQCDKCKQGYIYMPPKKKTMPCIMPKCKGIIRRKP